MKEIINIGVGQAGVQISDSLIKLYLAQHNLTPQGKKQEQIQSNLDKRQKITAARSCEHLQSIFDETSNQTYRPRFLYIDTQPDVINHSFKSSISDILVPDYMFYGKQSATTFGRAFFQFNQKFNFNNSYENMVRKAAENCDNLQAFVINHGIEGGTGSGAVAEIMQKLSDLFPKIIKSNFVVGVQRGSFTSVIGPYNGVLGFSRILQHSDTTIISCNRSLHQIAKTNLDIQFPNYQNINALIAQSNSFYTVFNRFGNSSLNCDLYDFSTNLVMYPRIHFAIPSFSPLVPQDNSYKWGQIYSQNLMLEKCYDKSCQFAYQGPSLNNRQDKNISAIILARGQFDVNKLAMAGRKLIKKNKWVDTLPTGIKIGLSPQKSTRYHENEVDSFLKKSVISYRSSMQISEMFGYLNHKFDLMYGKFAFLHWFIEDGMQQMEFSEARQDLAALEKDYEEILCVDQYDGCEEQECCESEDDNY